MRRLSVRRHIGWAAALTLALLSTSAAAPEAQAIKGGAVVPPGTFSFVVELAQRNAGGGWTLVCTGTLIDPWWVLTASHCAERFTGSPGDLAVASDGALVAHADRIDVEPGAANDGAAYINDLALVHLAAPDTTDTPVELARASDAPLWDPCGTTRSFAGCGTEAPVAGQAVQVLGYGSCGGPCASSATLVPGTLKMATINALSYASLRGAYTNSPYSSFVSSAYDNMVVGAGIVGGANDSCNGDSGGPLLVHGGDGRWREAAVTSWSEGACGPQIPNGVYMQLSLGPARRWIESLVPSVRDPSANGAAGYWMADANGNVYAFGAAHAFAPATTGFVVHIEPTPNGLGYWLVNLAGFVVGVGNARAFAFPPALFPGEYVVSISSTPDGGGYWLFTNLGRVMPFGDAGFYGDMRGTALKGAIIASVATPTGHGYYMVGRDGGVFTFGDAVFRGSMGAVRLTGPVIGIAATPDNRGYWLVATDGGVFAFNAPYYGSMGGTRLQQPVDALIAYGDGYLMVARDGGVFDFSDTPFAGSLGNHPPAAPVVGIAASP